MKEPIIIYAVSCGDYSDYRIEGLFSTRAKAEEYKESTMDPDYYNVEEYTLDELQPDRNEKLFCVHIDYENFTARVIERYYPDNHCYKGLNNTIQMTDSGEVKMYIVTTDPKRAVKIASERLTRIKAEEWMYPLLHEVCTFGEKGTGNSLSGQLRGLIAYPTLYNRYPVYRFGTGELVIPDDEEMISYTLV